MPAAVAAMKHVDIDVGDATAKSVFELYRAGRIYHYVVTVCDEAPAEQCPIFPGICERLHWTFPDPSAAESDRDRVALAVDVRKEIDARIRAWLSQLEAAGGPAPQFNRRPA